MVWYITQQCAKLLIIARKPLEIKGFRAFLQFRKTPLQHFCSTQCKTQPCCKFLSLSHIFQHPPVYANRRMFFSFSSWKAQRALCWANHSAKAADFRRSTAFQALKISIAPRSPGFLLPYITLQKGSVIPNSIPFTGEVSARTQSNAALFVLRRRYAEFMNKMSVKSRHIGIPHLGGYIRHRKIRLQQKLCADGTP